MATVRYNFVPSRARVQRAYYKSIVDDLNNQQKLLQDELEAAKAKAEREERSRQQAEERNDILLQQLADCESSKAMIEDQEHEPQTHFVQFDHNCFEFSSSEVERLKEFARSVMGKRLSILAEASTPGTEEYNQKLSERRLEKVVKALIDEGFTDEDLQPQIAIGEQNGKPSAEGRRVTITVE